MRSLDPIQKSRNPETSFSLHSNLPSQTQGTPFFVHFWWMILAVPFLALLRELMITEGSSRSVLGALRDPTVLSIAWFTLRQAALSLLGAALVGVPLGLWMGARANGKLPRSVEFLLSLPMGIPALLTVAAAVAWIGQNGFLTRLGIWPASWSYSLMAVVAVHAFWNSSWLTLRVAQTRAALSSERIEAARLLGSRPAQLFRFLIFPEIRTELFWASLQVFQLCAMSFVVVMALGGGPPVETLETAIYSKVRLSELDFPGAVACVLIQSFCTLVPGLFLMRYEWRGMESRSRSEGAFSHRGWVGPHRRLNSFRFALIALIIGLIPWIAAFDMKSFSSAYRWSLLPDSQAAVQISARIAVCSLSLCAAFTALLLRAARNSTERQKKWVIFSALFPAGLSTFVLGLGFWLAAEPWMDPFSDQLNWVIFLQAVLGVPFFFRSLWPLVNSPQHRLMDAARALGASPYRAFWSIEWPRWRGPLVSVLGAFFLASLGDLAALSLFSGGDFSSGVPLPVQVSRALARYQFDEVQGILLVLLLTGVLGMLLMRVLAWGVGVSLPAIQDWVSASRRKE